MQMFLGIFSTSKKRSKLEDKTPGTKSCLLTEQKKELKKRHRGFNFF